ncbi:MAG TPA: hypothetical protein VKB16_23870 [Beijerinckiaceae bacterium]|nr:hypothetical protein [Beijerinckiaceae bacterium]
MARPSKYPRYTEGYIDRHGKPRFYLRRPGAKRVALPGLPWSPEFMAAYQAAIDGVTLAARPIGATRALVGSTAEVVARYLLDASFTTLAASTRDKRRRFLDAFRAHYGKLPFAKLDTPSVAALLGKLTAHNQRDWLKTLRGLVRFAMARGYIGTDVRGAALHRGGEPP